MRVNYLNLTSGLEWAGKVSGWRLVRIQSSHFESNRMWNAAFCLDYQFLIDAATHGVNLYDCGSRRGEETRAQWKGVPWFKWAYAKSCNGEKEEALVLGYKSEKEFEDYYSFGDSLEFRKKAKDKFRYVCKLTGSKKIDINCFGMRSTMDGKTEDLARMASILY